jgi:hypothetical protein
MKASQKKNSIKKGYYLLKNTSIKINNPNENHTKKHQTYKRIENEQ